MKLFANRKPATIALSHITMSSEYDSIQTFGELLELLLVKRGMGQSDFANMVGLSRSEISNIKSGRRSCPSGKIDAMCQVLKLKPKAAAHFKRLALLTTINDEEAQRYFGRKVTPPPA